MSLLPNEKFNGQPIERQLDWFLNSNLLNLWLEDEHLQVYVRKSFRILDPLGMDPTNRVPCFDIANVSTVEEEFRGKGFFKNFIQYAEQHAQIECVYVELVFSKRLQEILEKNGYTLQPLQLGINFYKNCKKSLGNDTR